jgi:hypothetical protein
MTDEEIIEQIAKGLYFLHTPGFFTKDYMWDHIKPRDKDLMIAKARFVWSFVDDERAATEVDTGSVSEH